MSLAGAIYGSGQATKSDSYKNYFSPAKYTMFFVLGNYIPKGGILKVNLPKQVKLVSSPFTDLDLSSPNLIKTGIFESNSFKLKAAEKVESGTIKMVFGGIRNPVSYEPTGVFSFSSSDDLGNAVGIGAIDNIKMSEPWMFDNLIVIPANTTNGARTDYSVTFTASVPVYEGDIFNMIFPTQIKTPKEPTCAFGACLDEIACTSETGRIVVTLKKIKTDCLAKIGSEFTFTLNGIRNPTSLVTSKSLFAYWESSRYQRVANYSGDLSITNDIVADIDNSTISIHQVDKNFKVET